jgi:hypothetical protein
MDRGGVIVVTAFILLLVVHGLIHLLGVIKAFRLADLPQLTHSIAPMWGVMWLFAAALFLATALLVLMGSRAWWIVGTVAVAVSMFVIVPSWTDARAGALANGLVAVGLVFGFLAHGPGSLQVAYDRDVRARVAPSGASKTISESDLRHLPEPVQQYLRRVGAVGQPAVQNFHVRMHGRIRSASDARWMPFTAEQYTVVEPPTRLFYLSASMFGIPVQGYHRYHQSTALMHVKAAAALPVAFAEGRPMTESETVTFFNDLCVLAPATLIDPSIGWTTLDAQTVRATFRNPGADVTIRAELTFDGTGELVDFVSDDRYQIASDGTALKRRWSTPVGGYRSFGPARLPAHGEALWHAPDGAFSYIEVSIDEVNYNVR